MGFTALEGLCMGTRPGALDAVTVRPVFQDDTGLHNGCLKQGTIPASCQNQPLTAIRFGLIDSTFGSFSVSTPFFNPASIRSLATWSPSRKLR